MIQYPRVELYVCDLESGTSIGTLTPGNRNAVIRCINYPFQMFDIQTNGKT